MDLNDVTRIVALGDDRFPVVDTGAGPPVLLLHGFPDSRFLWRHQVPALADAGYRVIAPDLRGFGDAPRPADIRAYRRPFLIADVLGLLDQLGLARVHLVGHDWGASLSWRIAGSFPDRVDRLVALSVGAPASPGWETIAQREKSWYFDFFCKQGIAEAALAADDWALFREWCRAQGDQERYLRDFARPGALTAALNWYRAAFTPLEAGEPLPPALPHWDRVKSPTLGIWGADDPFLLEPQIALSAPAVDAPWRYERVNGAGHWLMLDQPAILNTLLLEFLRWNPRLTSFAPQFLVKDLARSIAYWQKVGFAFGEPWEGFYAIGHCDGLELHLKEAPRLETERQHRRESEHLDAAAGVDGIEAFYARCVSNGVPIMKPLTTTEWGTKDFYVEDPDGNIVSFGGRPIAE